MVVSVHDVCPRTRAAVDTVLRALDSLGVRRRSLLVIPAEPGGELDRATAAWLARRAGEGDELVQHGYYHCRCGAAAPFGGAEEPLGGAARFFDAWLGRGAGEFAALGLAEAAARLAAGRRRLAEFGLHCAGFTAPAWLYSPAAAEAVGRAGFRYYTTHLRLRDLARGRDHWAFGLCGRPGSLPDDLLGRGVTETLALLHTGAPLMRLAFHPADLTRHRPIQHSLSLLRRLLAAGRRPTTYLDYLERARP